MIVYKIGAETMIDVQFPWPERRQAAVSLTFDDGLRSQLDLAVPILNQHGICATFYLNPREGFEVDLLPWREVASAGHEIGNHTVTHPCSANFPFISVLGRKALEDMGLEEIEAEIVEAGRRLHEVIPGQGRVSFGYPCYQPFVGRGLTRRSYVPVVAQHCVAGRGRGERANDPRYCDVAYLWSSPCERLTGAHLIGLVEEAVREGRWAILTFHGIHEGHLAVGDTDLDQLCEYLEVHGDRIWSAPVATVATYVTNWQGEQSPGL